MPDYFDDDAPFQPLTVGALLDALTNALKQGIVNRDAPVSCVDARTVDAEAMTITSVFYDENHFDLWTDGDTL